MPTGYQIKDQSGIFSELILSENTLRPKLKKEFEYFEKAIISYCAPSDWISD